MEQLNTISRLKKIFSRIPGLDIALLYGSFGRNTATPNSDIDIQLLVNKEFIPALLKAQVQKEFNTEIKSICEVEMRSKIVIYFKFQPKIEFAVCTNIAEIDKNYLGSEIINVKETVLYERRHSDYEIEKYLDRLVGYNNNKRTLASSEKLIGNLIDKFIYEFESCSAMHRRSDGYQFYFFYNIALQIAIQLNYLAKGHFKFNFLPKYFIANVLSQKEQKTFYDLKGTLFLPEANQQKRRLLDFFYSALETLAPPEKSIEIKQFCEWLFDRDYFWNFRDISTHNPKVKSGRIYRAATMTFFQHENRFEKLLRENNIKTVIDLRTGKEIEENPYTEQTLSKFNYIKVPLDPWNQPEWFKRDHSQGSNEEIAYRFFVLACNDKIKNAMEAILNEKTDSIVIHCFAGKDRTGIFISMLHLLAESSMESIHADYLASEVDVNLSRLKLVLDIIEEKGGIGPYLLFCGLSVSQISKLKQKLLG